MQYGDRTRGNTDTCHHEDVAVIPIASLYCKCDAQVALRDCVPDTPGVIGDGSGDKQSMFARVRTCCGNLLAMASAVPSAPCAEGNPAMERERHQSGSIAQTANQT